MVADERTLLPTLNRASFHSNTMAAELCRQCQESRKAAHASLAEGGELTQTIFPTATMQLDFRGVWTVSISMASRPLKHGNGVTVEVPPASLRRPNCYRAVG